MGLGLGTGLTHLAIGRRVVVQLDAVLQSLGQWQGSLCEPIDVRLGSAVVQQLGSS